MRSLPLLVLCTVLLSTAARASEAPAPPQAVPGSSAPFRSCPDAFAPGPTAPMVAARTRPSVVWTLAPARLGHSGTGAVVMGWF